MLRGIKVLTVFQSYLFYGSTSHYRTNVTIINVPIVYAIIVYATIRRTPLIRRGLVCLLHTKKNSTNIGLDFRQTS